MAVFSTTGVGAENEICICNHHYSVHLVRLAFAVVPDYGNVPKFQQPVLLLPVYRRSRFRIGSHISRQQKRLAGNPVSLCDKLPARQLAAGR